MKKIVTLIGILLTANMMACSTHSGNVRATDQSLIDKIKIGKTTKEEVRSLMGETSNISRQSESETWTYMYNQTDMGAKAFIPFANLTGESPIGVRISTLTITFNKSGIVENIASSANGNN